MVRVVGGWLVDFWGMWYRIVAKAGCIGYALVMGDIMIWRRWWRDRIVWQRWVGIGLLALLLMAKVIDDVL
jgi:hypothetical protein